MSQSNTRVGDIRVLAGEALTGMEGRLVKMTHDTGVAEMKLPAANADYALFVVIEGGADEALVSVRPIQANRNVRLALKGTCNPGDVLVLADVGTSGDKGKVRALPTAGGTYRGLAMAEEAGVDGQFVLARPAMLGNIVVT
ncbi:MAG: hypothetical protein NTV49_14505 [Kiritimatiellaeota bacterium]|nr:hypothetical protein [Kiritimatiellota bacterium]